MYIKFTKMHGLGNDFIVLDLIAQKIRVNKKLVRTLADRHFGIGCDQVLVVEPPRDPDTEFFYRIFNSDGNEVQQCGNGARCFGKYISDKGYTGSSKVRVESLAGQMELERIDADHFRVNMGVPVLEPVSIPIDATKRALTYPVQTRSSEYAVSAVSMGNPHAVIFVDTLRNLRLDKVGRELSQHAMFPEQANIGFVCVQDKQNFDLRVYERGVGETLACGSGACAAMVAGRLRKLLGKSVSAQLRGGMLDLQWKGEGEPVYMTGPASTVFEGQIRV